MFAQIFLKIREEVKLIKVQKVKRHIINLEQKK